MPMVNGKEFPYTPQGKKAARDYKNSLNKKTKKLLQQANPALNH